MTEASKEEKIRAMFNNGRHYGLKLNWNSSTKTWDTIQYFQKGQELVDVAVTNNGIPTIDPKSRSNFDFVNVVKEAQEQQDEADTSTISYDKFTKKKN